MFGDTAMRGWMQKGCEQETAESDLKEAFPFANRVSTDEVLRVSAVRRSCTEPSEGQTRTTKSHELAKFLEDVVVAWAVADGIKDFFRGRDAESAGAQSGTQLDTAGLLQLHFDPRIEMLLAGLVSLELRR